MTETTAITTQQQIQLAEIPPAPAGLATIEAEIQQFEFDWRKAQALSRSRMVPAHFQGKAEDCMVAVMMARQLGINDLLALQNIQLISGRPGFSASFAIGMANTRGPFAGPITWETKGKGDSLAVTAMATVRATGERVSATVSMEIAKAEGWTKNAKYRSMPEQMLRYRSATWLIRLHCPEVLLGMSTAEELADIQPARVSVEPEVQAAPLVADLNQQIRQRASTAENPEPVPAAIEETEPAAEPVAVDALEAADPFA